jgi:hypothetical protein
MRSSLKRLEHALTQGRAPTVAIWRTQRRRPSASVLIRRHGSWKAAVTAALDDLAPGSGS